MTAPVRRSVGQSLGRFDARRISIPFSRKWLGRLSYRCNLRPEAETGAETIKNKNNKKGNQYRKDGPETGKTDDTLALRHTQALPALDAVSPRAFRLPPQKPQRRGGRMNA